MTVRESLIKALELIEKGWCQGANARDRAGIQVSVNNPSAVQFCAVGALMKVNPRLRIVDLEQLRKFLPLRESNMVTHWNDSPDRNKEQVIELFRKAINDCS